MHYQLIVGILFVSMFANLHVRADPPNIVILLADDLGWNAVGYHNEAFKTPHIDSLVRSGIELDRFYVAPMCSPTRAGLMTGRYPIRFGLARAVIPPQRDYGLPTDETTIAEALANVGYQHRGVFGKWHLGHRRAKWHPLNRGFTHFHGHYNGAIDYFELTREAERDWHVDFEPSDQQGYSTDLIAEAAANWIETSARDDSPYFCYVPFNAPHSPFQAPADALAEFSSFASTDAKSPERSAARNPDAKNPARRKADKVRQTYAAMIWKMDQGIGRILEAIERSGEADNTLVWFFSDNGGVGGIRQNNAPLRGSKLTVYEGGVRVTACVRWPNEFASGQTISHPMGYIDVYPTLLAAAQRDDETFSDKPLDGVNVLPILRGQAPSSEITGRPWFSYHGQAGEDREHLAVAKDGWKLKVNGPVLTRLSQLTDGSNQVELFQLEKDPLESTDVKASHGDKLKQLGELLIEHRSSQPAGGVPIYSVGKQGFVPPKRWQLDPTQPDRLIGSHRNPR